MSITCAIMAGGRSSRMGVDKAMLDIDGQTMLALAIHLGREACGRVMVVGRNRSPGDADAIYISDQPGPFRGPIAGIVTALEQAETAVLALACDAPLLRIDTVRALLEAHRTNSAKTLATVAIVATEEKLRAEPLLAVYTLAMTPILKGWMATGRRSLQPLLETPGVHLWNVPEAGQEDLFNVNDPASLSEARLRWRRRNGV